MSTRWWELVATNESTVIAEFCLDGIAVKGGEHDGSFPDPPCTDESDGFEIFGKINNLLDQAITSETCPQGRRR